MMDSRSQLIFLVLTVLALKGCSAGFAGGGGSADTRQFTGVNTPSGPFGTDGGQGDSGRGDDAGDTDSGDGDGDSGDSASDSGADAGGDNDGDGDDDNDDGDDDNDDGDDDDDSGGGGGGSSTTLRLPLTILSEKHSEKTSIRLQYFSGSKEGKWIQVEAPGEKKVTVVPNICSKKGDTSIRIELSGGRVIGAAVPHKHIKRRGGGGGTVIVGFESSGTCGIFDSGILANDCHDDEIIHFTCPKGDLEIDNM